MEDLNRIVMPQWVIEGEGAWNRVDLWQDIVGDILNIRIEPKIRHLSAHLTAHYVEMRGPENLLLDLYEEPEMFHAAMQKFADGYVGLAKHAEQMGLLALNNDITYHNSGGVGYSDELPATDFSGRARLCDLWGSSEAQEFAPVSPRMHREFVLNYERPYLEMFGLSGYGCCEPLERKLQDVFKIKNMRRISISPFSDVRSCAEQMRAVFVFVETEPCTPGW